ncbi:MAG: FtsK/SpoIIIE domain-containing protein, partial [Clostridia bacterium]
GKSVFINSFITSILYKYSPEDVRLLLIDPKRVELSVYQGLPNLLIKETVKEPDHAVNLLRWLTQEMERRYGLMEKNKCNELDAYNELEREKGVLTKLPRIVLVIDEMAELMIRGKGQVEEYIVRIAQLGRASGIHLVLATQRPTVNVITGLIRANILARVAFSVITNQDSRIILDTGGAEGLLGKGDMLFSFKKSIERVQGAFIDIKELREVCDFIKKHNDGDFDDELATLIKNKPQEEQEKEKAAMATERDNDYENTLKRILKTYILENRASISNAQAKHNVGYIKAKKILDDLADRGYVSSSDPSKPREVLISMEEYKKIFESDE